MLCIVRGGSRVVVDEAILEAAVHQYGKCSGGGGDRLRLADAESEAPIKPAESGLRAAETHRDQSQDRRGAIGRGHRLGAEESPAGDVVLRREGEPGGEVLFAAPPAHVRADLAQEAERGVGADRIDLRQVHTGELVQRACARS